MGPLEYLGLLFSTDGFMPRRLCGTGWDVWMVGANVGFNFLIFAAYLSIPYTIYGAMRRYRLRLPPGSGLIGWFFVVFIVACGLTHLFDLMMYYVPLYRLQPYILGVTAFASLGVAIALPSAVRAVAAVVEERDRERAARKAAQAQVASVKSEQERMEDEARKMREENRELRQDVSRRQAEIRALIESLPAMGQPALAVEAFPADVEGQGGPLAQS